MLTLAEITEQAKQLTADEQAILYHDLRDQLAEIDPEIHELWRQEVSRRIAAHRANPEPTFSEEEVMTDEC